MLTRPLFVDEARLRPGLVALAPPGRAVYLLFVDESGTHGGSPAFVLGGLAVHEDDAPRLQRQLDALVVQHLGYVPVNLDEFELHATEMRNAKKQKMRASGAQPVSAWAHVPRSTRLRLLDEAYGLVANFAHGHVDLPHALFCVVVDARFRHGQTAVEREQFAYEVLLNKFDIMLKRVRTQRDRPNRGLVIHDRRVVAERDIQTWTSQWRAAAGAVGQLHNLADVPLFADSRATRLLQVADIVAYALYRNYNPESSDDHYLRSLWPRFDADGAVVHGCVHFTPSFGRGACSCVSCSARLHESASADAP